MFDARFKDPTKFKLLVTILKDIVTDCVIQCRPDGVWLQTMDASHVALCTFCLSIEAFDNYDCEQPVHLGIHLPSLDSILKCCKKDDQLTLKSSAVSSTLELVIENKSTHRHAIYGLNLMHIDVGEFELSQSPYSTTIHMSACQLQDTFKDLVIIGDTCKITSCPNRIQFITSGDMGHVKLSLHNGTTDNTDTTNTTHIVTNTETTLTFALRYLLLFAKASALTDTVAIHLHDEAPMKLLYKICDYGELCFYIAPRYDNE